MFGKISNRTQGGSGRPQGRTSWERTPYAASCIHSEDSAHACSYTPVWTHTLRLTCICLQPHTQIDPDLHGYKSLISTHYMRKANAHPGPWLWSRIICTEGGAVLPLDIPWEDAQLQLRVDADPRQPSHPETWPSLPEDSPPST